MPKTTIDNSKTNLQDTPNYHFLLQCMAVLLESIAAAGSFVLAATLTNSTVGVATTSLAAATVTTSSLVPSIALLMIGLVVGFCILAALLTALLSNCDCSTTHSNEPNGFYDYNRATYAGPGFWNAPYSNEYEQQSHYHGHTTTHHHTGHHHSDHTTHHDHHAPHTTHYHS